MQQSVSIIKIIASFCIALCTVLAICVYGALNGWWLKPLAEKGNAADFSRAAQNLLHQEKAGNTALVIISNGQVTLEDYSASVDDINSDTLFPVASMSKLFSAYGAHLLAQAQKLDMHVPVTNYLTRWQLPDSEFDHTQVTMARLLSHTAGLADGLGFGDYSAQETLPTLEESLSNPRSSDGQRKIAVASEPGSQWQYSGGSYLMAELVIEEITGEPFAEWMQREFFMNLGMTRSNYDYLGKQTNIARPYGIDGSTAPVYQYASKAATAFNSTPADLIRFTKALATSGHTTDQGLTKLSLEAMREPLGKTMGAAIWGPGAMLYAPTDSGDFIFGHDGANDPAINSTLRVNPDNADAIIVLTTGNPRLASRLGNEWVLWQTGMPDFLHIETALASAILPTITGFVLLLIGHIGYWVYRRNAASAYRNL